MLCDDLVRVYGICLPAIGGEENADVHFILHERPAEVTRNSFFSESTWAIQGSGISRKGNATFCTRITECGFPWADFMEFATWQRARRNEFYAQLYHPGSISGRGRMKWDAIEEIARLLAGFKSEAEFRADLFGGKTRSADLNREDVRRLRARRLSFIGPANSQYVIRNMGGESIKCDRWILAFLDYFDIAAGLQLEEELVEAGISLSLFDTVIWAYCERFVRRVADFAPHFDRLLS